VTEDSQACGSAPDVATAATPPKRRGASWSTGVAEWQSSDERAAKRAGGSFAPRPPIDLGDATAITDHFAHPSVGLSSSLLTALRATGAQVHDDARSRAEAGRDWWPISLHWGVRGEVPYRPAAVVRPETTTQVAAVVGLCDAAGVPVTAAGGRSGVCGGSIPLFGGVALDCCGLSGPVELDEDSSLVEVGAGTSGPELEDALRARQYTLGHFPQSFELSTVGGWIACRGAGQYSTRYGKIEDLVRGLEVVLADGTILRTGGLQGAGPRSATGPDLTQLLLGSEGTLGVITRAQLLVRPLPRASTRAAYLFPSFAAGLDCVRRILRRGATPAVLRLYDEAESTRLFDLDSGSLLLVYDEADPELLAATLAIVDHECLSTREDRARDVVAGRQGTAHEADPGLVDRWLATRDDVSALVHLTRAGVIVDTTEISAPYRCLGRLYREVTEELRGLPENLAISAHLSHAYPDGACLYFSFALQVREEAHSDTRDRAYVAHLERIVALTERAGGSISHHHGIGLARGGYLEGALGRGYSLLRVLKATLDPRGTLNPGKLGLSSRYGEIPWPPAPLPSDTTATPGGRTGVGVLPEAGREPESLR